MATKINLVMDQGSDFEVEFTFTDSDGEAPDLSAHTGRAQMRLMYNANVAYPFGVSTASGGKATLVMSSANTTIIPSNTYVYDVEVVSTGNVVTRVVEGTITVTPEVTR